MANLKAAPRLRRSSVRAVLPHVLFHISSEVYSWTRMTLAMIGLVFLVVTFLVPPSSVSFGTYRLTPTAEQLTSCYAVEGTTGTWVCSSPLGNRPVSSSGGTLLTQ